MSAANEWNVVSRARSRARGANLSSRSRISAAALFVKVRPRTRNFPVGAFSRIPRLFRELRLLLLRNVLLVDRAKAIFAEKHFNVLLRQLSEVVGLLTSFKTANDGLLVSFPGGIRVCHAEPSDAQVIRHFDESLNADIREGKQANAYGIKIQS